MRMDLLGWTRKGRGNQRHKGTLGGNLTDGTSTLNDIRLSPPSGSNALRPLPRISYEQVWPVAIVQSAPKLQPTHSALTVEQDDDGQYVIADILGAVYGVGASVEEAKEDFNVALRDHLRFLREHLAELSEGLRDQLVALQKLFPGV